MRTLDPLKPLLRIGLALVKHHIKSVIGDDALQVVATTLADVGDEKIHAKVNSIFASIEGKNQLLKAAKVADQCFKEKCKDEDMRGLFTMEYGSLLSIQTALSRLPESFGDEMLRQTIFTVFRRDLPKRISDKQIDESVNLYIDCIQRAVLPVKDFGLRIIHNALAEIGKDVKDIKSDVKLLLDKTESSSPPLGQVKNTYSQFLVPFPRNPDFVGREKEISSLHEMLQQGQSPVGIRPTVLVGLGGIGKTQLAVEYAHAHRADYPDGVFWLNANNSLLQEFAKLAEQLELADTDTSRNLAAQRCYQYLNEHTASLVIFDNVEEPKNLNIPFSSVIIPANLQCRTLFTTRNRDFPSPFQAFEVKILPVEGAMRLLLRHPLHTPILRSDHPDHHLAQIICSTLGYLPLALAIAGSFLAENPDVTMFDYRVRLLDEGAMDVIDATSLDPEQMPTRHETAVRATLRTSWDAMTDQNARLALLAAGQLREAELIPISRLSLLTGLSAEARPGYPNEITKTLRKLYTASLIEELTSERLRLHPLVHAFAAQLAPNNFRSELADRVTTMCSDLERLENSVTRYGIDLTLEDLQTGLELYTLTTANEKAYHQLSKLERVLSQEAHHLRNWNQKREPGFFLQQVCNRALELG